VTKDKRLALVLLLNVTMVVALVVVGLAALRISELLALRPSDVNGGAINVRSGKVQKQRIVTYDSLAAGYLSGWLAVKARLGVNGRQPLFCSVASGQTRTAGTRIDPSYMRHLLPRLAVRAGIESAAIRISYGIRSHRKSLQRA
jgi:integrase